MDRLRDSLGRYIKTDAETRFWDKVGPPDKNECWPWTGSKNDWGYGYFWSDRNTTGHAYSYLLHIGDIPEGKQIDHICRNRGCVNPIHLEAVTEKENILRGTSGSAINARKTHCVRGHEFNSGNTYITTSGKRMCRECSRMKDRKYRIEGRKK